ncbi:MAG: hypothetical protein R3E79_59735 [Caldilineaceae bacterium]
MKRQSVSFEWHVAEDEATWEEMALAPVPLPAAQLRATPVDQRLGFLFLRGVAICLASVVLVAAVELTPAERERFHATAGIQAVLAKEAQEAAQAESETEAALRLEHKLNAILPAHRDAAVAALLQTVGVALIRVEPIGELALAEVLLSQSVQGWQAVNTYRETRFYRETEQGWRQTAPERAFWGQPIYRETAHLRFEFSARDAATVEPLLAQIEHAYLAIHQRLGVFEPSTRQKLTIEITPNRVTGRGIYRNRLQVASPLVSQIPSEFSATAYLAHQIVNRLLTETINGSATREALGMRSEDSFAFRWRAMRRGLRSWLQTDLLAEPWASDHQAAELFQRTYRTHAPLTLNNVIWGTELPLADDARMMWQNAAAESVVAYLVERYGRERLPDLLRGFHQSNDWNTLVTSVFGLSVAEFEDGWNRYLQQQTQTFQKK